MQSTLLLTLPEPWPCAWARRRLTAVRVRSDLQAVRRHGPPTSVEVCQQIAAARVAESKRLGGPLFIDPYAEVMSGPLTSGRADPWDAAMDVIATRHIDTCLMNATAAAAVTRITKGDYKQVVLVGDGLDTRPYRLPWPPGTLLFVVAPAEVHAAAEAALATPGALAAAEAAAAAGGAAATAPELAATTTTEAAEAAASGTGASGVAGGEGGEAAGPGPEGAKANARRRSAPKRPPGPRPPPGCLLRRVSIDLAAASSSNGGLAAALASSGFRADRLSVWAFQGLAGIGLKEQALLELLSEAANAAAYNSLLLGELPAGGAHEAANLIADVGLLGAPLDFGSPDADYGRWRPEWSARGQEQEAGHRQGSQGGNEGQEGQREGPGRVLFTAQQVRLSLAEMDTYNAHLSAAEATDEDFFDNFS